MMKDDKTLTEIPETAVALGPMASAQILLDKNVDIEKVKDMIEVQAIWDALQAKKAYVHDMAEFKKAPPEILKDAHVEFKTSSGKTSYDHASLGNVTKSINVALSKHGFSSSWATHQPDNNIEVTCTITHKLGHSESTMLKSPADSSGGKNPIQAISSTVTYLERYTLLALTGLATHGQDDDGVGASQEVEYLSDKQKGCVVDMLADSGSDERAFLRYLGVESLDVITADSYSKVIATLRAKKEQQKAKEKVENE